MYWIIHYGNGVAITRADDHQAAKKWCYKHLGKEKGPFAITPASNEDMTEMTEVNIDKPGFNVKNIESDGTGIKAFHIYNDPWATRH